MNQSIVEAVYRLINSPEASIGEVVESSEEVVKFKLNYERAKQLGVKPSIGDFIIIEGVTESPIAVIYSYTTKSNMPASEYVGLTRDERLKIFYEPSTTIYTCLISGYFSRDEGFIQELPSESILPDDQVFYLAMVPGAIKEFHTHSNGILVDYVPRLIEKCSGDLIKLFFKKLRGFLDAPKQVLLESVLDSFKRRGAEKLTSKLIDTLIALGEVD